MWLKLDCNFYLHIQIKVYNIIGGAIKENFKDIELKGVTLFFSPKKGTLALLFDKNERLNYSPKTITVYFKNTNSLPRYSDGTFMNFADPNNWTDYIKNEFRKPRYIVDRIEFNDVMKDYPQ